MRAAEPGAEQQAVFQVRMINVGALAPREPPGPKHAEQRIAAAFVTEEGVRNAAGVEIGEETLLERAAPADVG